MAQRGPRQVHDAPRQSLRVPLIPRSRFFAGPLLACPERQAMGDKLAGPESQTMGDDGQTMGYKLAGPERFFKGFFKGL